MNKPIRKVSIAFALLFLALFVNLNVVQVLEGSRYRNDRENARVLLNEYSNPRGQIVVDGRAIATSEKTKDDLKYLRKYPDGPVYSTVTGYYSYVYGSAGLESAENGILTGDAPDLFGSKLSDLLTGRDPKGGSVELTLNREAQRAAYKAMAGRRGAVVALNPKTGAVLAMVSSPSYDPNLLSSHDTTTISNAYRKYNLTGSNQPLLNRALRAVYPAGSIFKVIDTAAALSADPTLTPGTRLPSPNSYHPLDPGNKSACPKGGGGACVQNFDAEVCDNGTTATLALALAKSCNTTFSKLAVDKLGDGKLSAQAQKFGLDAPYPGDSPGDLCDPPLFRIPLAACHSTPGSEGDLTGKDTLAQTAIGQRDVAVTPLQAAMISAAVANDGTLMKPYLVAKELRPDLSVLNETTPKQFDQVLAPDRDATLIDLMLGVVENPRGTGGTARITELGPDIRVGGKTGTADHGVKDPKTGMFPPPHAWFTGFALDKGDPKIAVAVIIEDGGVNGNETTGGKAAAPVAKDVMLAYLRTLRGN